METNQDDFWNAITVSNIEELLEKENLTAEEILADECFLQEFKNMNPVLMTFFSKDKIKQILKYVFEMPQENYDDLRKFKYPYIVCEMCICDINILFKIFAGANLEEPQENEQNYDEFLKFIFSYIEQNKIVKNNVLVGYLSKILLQIYESQQKLLIDYVFFNEKNIFAFFIDFLQYSALSEFIWKIAAYDKKEISPYLEKRKKFLQDLMNVFANSTNEDEIENTSLILCKIIEKNQLINSGDEILTFLLQSSLAKILNERLNTIKNQSQVLAVCAILNTIFHEYCIQEYIYFLRQIKNLILNFVKIDYFLFFCKEFNREAFNYFLQEFINIIPELIQSLEINNDTYVDTPVQKVNALGQIKFAIIQLLFYAMQINNIEINKAITLNSFCLILMVYFLLRIIQQLEIIQRMLMEQFFAFTCGKSYTLKYAVAIQNFNFYYQLIHEGEFIKFLLEMSKLTTILIQEKQLRPGNIAFLSEMGNELVNLNYEDELQMAEWQEFFESFLKPTNERNTKFIGGQKNSEEYENMQELYMQQKVKEFNLVDNEIELFEQHKQKQNQEIINQDKEQNQQNCIQQSNAQSLSADIFDSFNSASFNFSQQPAQLSAGFSDFDSFNFPQNEKDKSNKEQNSQPINPFAEFQNFDFSQTENENK